MLVKLPRSAAVLCTALATAIALLLALALSTSSALAGTVSFDGPALVFTAVDDADHDMQFRLDRPAGEDIIIDSQPITSRPVQCLDEPSGPFAYGVRCPGSLELRVELGSGDDDLVFDQGSSIPPVTEGDCFDSYVLNLGDGNNSNRMNQACETPATLAITSGSGDDTLKGGPAGTSATIAAGGGRDTFNPSTVPDPVGDDVVYGGDGDDTLWGMAGNDQVYGEGGNDRLLGGAGNDVEDGGPGDDYIGFVAINSRGEDDAGADHLRGGAGLDQLFLDGHAGAMAISLDDQANDGAPGEGDNVGSDIETILGTGGNDVMFGSAGGQRLDGYSGNDEIHAAAGDDTVIGSDGDDNLFGDEGNDHVEGRYGIDRVDGGAGADVLFGDIDGCTGSYCEPDTDALFARDGERDVVNCGGPGSAQVDGLDVVFACGAVDRSRGDDALAAPSFGTVGRPSRSRGVKVRVACAAACAFTAKLTISRKLARRARLGRRRTTIGTSRASLAGAGSKTVTVRTSSKARRRLRRIKSVPARLAVRATQASVVTTTRRSLKLAR
jgi:Ca2+-binding RTX toxin-like protein